MLSRPISPGFVEDALAALSGHAVDSGNLVSRLCLPDSPGSWLTAAEFGRLWLALADGLDDEFFGLGLRPMRRGSFALMCQAAAGAGTLGAAIRRMTTFLGIAMDGPRGRLSTRDGLAILALDPLLSPRAAFAYRSYWLMVMGVSCWLVSARIPLRSLAFDCPAPPDRPDYESFFGVPVAFSQPATLLTFESTWLSRPLQRNEAALRRFLAAAPANILLRYRHDGGVTQRLRRLFAETSPSDWPDQKLAAQQLRMSEAILRRRLRSEGSSFAALKDAAAEVAALRLLSGGAKTIAEVASELGYSEPSAFYRAFRKWKGTSPAAYRAKTILAAPARVTAEDIAGARPD